MEGIERTSYFQEKIGNYLQFLTHTGERRFPFLACGGKSHAGTDPQEPSKERCSDVLHISDVPTILSSKTFE